MADLTPYNEYLAYPAFWDWATGLSDGDFSLLQEYGETLSGLRQEDVDKDIDELIESGRRIERAKKRKVLDQGDRAAKKARRQEGHVHASSRYRTNKDRPRKHAKDNDRKNTLSDVFEYGEREELQQLMNEEEVEAPGVYWQRYEQYQYQLHYDMERRKRHGKSRERKGKTVVDGTRPVTVRSSSVFDEEALRTALLEEIHKPTPPSPPPPVSQQRWRNYPTPPPGYVHADSLTSDTYPSSVYARPMKYHTPETPVVSAFEISKKRKIDKVEPSLHYPEIKRAKPNASQEPSRGPQPMKVDAHVSSNKQIIYPMGRGDLDDFPSQHQPLPDGLDKVEIIKSWPNHLRGDLLLGMSDLYPPTEIARIFGNTDKLKANTLVKRILAQKKKLKEEAREM